ncbi:MAG: nuclear transport factor 2 family protein [Gemmatimonadales bacterium]
MHTETSANELMEQERRFWDAIQDRDHVAVAAMTDDKCLIVGAQGVTAIDPIKMAKLTEEGTWQLLQWSFDPKSTQVHFLNEDVALVAYRVSESLIVDGKPLILHANDSSVWVRRDGRWYCAMHTETPAGDPFGRDRIRG